MPARDALRDPPRAPPPISSMTVRIGNPHHAKSPPCSREDRWPTAGRTTGARDRMPFLSAHDREPIAGRPVQLTGKIEGSSREDPFNLTARLRHGHGPIIRHCADALDAFDGRGGYVRGPFELPQGPRRTRPRSPVGMDRACARLRPDSASGLFEFGVDDVAVFGSLLAAR